MTKEEFERELEEQTLEELVYLGQTIELQLFDDYTPTIQDIDYTIQHWLHCPDWIPVWWNWSDDWYHWRECRSFW